MTDLRYKKDSVYESLKNDILDGTYPPHSKVPRELDFSRQLGVGKVTLRSALDRLEAEGLVARIPSKGTFILPAESRKTSSQGTLLVITTDLKTFESPNSYILPGIVRTASLKGLPTETCERSYIEQLTSDELSFVLKDKHIVGIVALLSHFNGDEPIIGKLRQTGLPVVLPHAHKDDTRLTGFASIVVTEREGWREALRHLRDHGHERVATIALADNFRGFTPTEHLDLLSSYGAEASKTLLGTAPYEKEAVAAVVDKWMALDVPPTAILCFSDFFAIHVFNALKARKLRIPDDVAVMGCCGYPGGSFLSPPLSTMDYGYEELGKQSVELLTESAKWFPLKPGTAVPCLFTKPTLVFRQSTNIRRLERTITTSSLELAV